MNAIFANIFSAKLTSIAGMPTIAMGIDAISKGPHSASDWLSAVAQIATGIGLLLAPDGHTVEKK